VENLKRGAGARESSSYSSVRQSPEAPGSLSPRDGMQKAQEGRFREAGSPADVERSGEATESHESIGSGLPWRSGKRIPAGRKTLKPRGIVTSWSSELEDAMSRTAGREWAPKGVRLCGGETL